MLSKYLILVLFFFVTVHGLFSLNSTNSLMELAADAEIELTSGEENPGDAEQKKNFNSTFCDVVYYQLIVKSTEFQSPESFYKSLLLEVASPPPSPRV